MILHKYIRYSHLEHPISKFLTLKVMEKWKSLWGCGDISSIHQRKSNQDYVLGIIRTFVILLFEVVGFVGIFYIACTQSFYMILALHLTFWSQHILIFYFSYQNFPVLGFPFLTWPIFHKDYLFLWDKRKGQKTNLVKVWIQVLATSLKNYHQNVLHSLWMMEKEKHSIHQ